MFAFNIIVSMILAVSGFILIGKGSALGFVNFACIAIFWIRYAVRVGNKPKPEIFPLISNPPYTVEIRNVAPGGAVTYLPQRYEEWSHTEDIAAIRQHTFNRIYHSVFYDGLQYNFSRSGHVYAIEGTECGAPFNFVHAWDWSGDPHQFPYYNQGAASDPCSVIRKR